MPSSFLSGCGAETLGTARRRAQGGSERRGLTADMPGGDAFDRYPADAHFHLAA
jgi:hypothetical protein